MAKITSTVWPKDRHTEAKHIILEHHLNAWFPILSMKFGRVVYLDGFAGPGVYSKGEEGSPVIAIRTALNHLMNEKFGEITFAFIEKDPKRAETLKKVLKDRFPKLPSKLNYYVYQDEFAPSIEATLDGLEKDGLKLAPTFAFIDPFGYKHFPLKTIARLLDHERCEVLITFMIDYVNRFTDITPDVLDELFGTDEWRKKIKDLKNSKERQKYFLSLYKNQLKKVAGVKFVRTFQMIRKDGHTLYYLIFGTNHWQGMRAMKDAMFAADKRGIYRFSDREDPHQTYLADIVKTDTWIPEAADIVYQKFKGMSINASTVKQFVYTDTRFRYRKDILQYLEESKPPKILRVEDRKVKGFNYPDRCLIEFS